MKVKARKTRRRSANQHHHAAATFLAFWRLTLTDDDLNVFIDVRKVASSDKCAEGLLLLKYVTGSINALKYQPAFEYLVKDDLLKAALFTKILVNKTNKIEKKF